MMDLLELERELERFLDRNAYGLVDFQVVGQGRGRAFKLFIERADGSPIDLGDCERLSPLIRLHLESINAFNGDSTLQVSSPGIDRLLKRDIDFERFAGLQVSVTLRVEGRKYSFGGGLVGMKDGSLHVQTTGLPQGLVGEMGILMEAGVASIPRKLVTAVRLKAEG